MGAVKLVCCGAAVPGRGEPGRSPCRPNGARLCCRPSAWWWADSWRRRAPAGSFSVVSAPQPSSASGSGYQSETIDPDGGGQFQTSIEIEGQRLPALVDTGATYVVLSFEDAARLGLRPMPSDFKYKTWTANGVALNAMAELREVRLGSIEVRDVPVLIAARGSMTHNLLGMTFLSKLHGFRVDAGRLVLQQ